ncbi:MAG: glycosyltransferase family 4 protein [Herpetosiphonaceae bacterium]|nr:glycosyltransferase family 4 protein [Herpetosiphonaceae bacterium]
MRLLYVAAGIAVPGSYGGSTHTLEVARGLCQLGHEVHVVAHHPQRQWRAMLRPVDEVRDGIHMHYLDVPKAVGLGTYPQMARLIRTLKPHAVIERYYNLAGAGVLVAARMGIPVLLEVNALMIDPPGVLKRRLDDLLGGPLQRWAIRQCELAARIVTPLQTTVPPVIDRRKIVQLPWGANVEEFRPRTEEANDRLRQTLGIPPERPVAVFLGSFRAWHGVRDFVGAAVQLLHTGISMHFLLIGDGPERAAAEAASSRWSSHFTFLGSLRHSEVPQYLALAQVGVAPFNTAPHPALRAAGFFWSPLKIYEYMAMGLPVVTVRIPPLDNVIREGQEGALFQEGNIDDLAAAMVRVVTSPERAAMGQQARERVVAHFSWQAHCKALEGVLEEIVSAAAKGQPHIA